MKKTNVNFFLLGALLVVVLQWVFSRVEQSAEDALSGINHNLLFLTKVTFLSLLSYSIFRLGLTLYTFSKTKEGFPSEPDVFFLGIFSASGLFIYVSLGEANAGNFVFVAISVVHLALRFIFCTYVDERQNVTYNLNDPFFEKELNALSNSKLVEKFTSLVTGKKNDGENFGVSGAWGIGKTSFLEMVYRKVKSEHHSTHSCVWIDLWAIRGPNNILKFYFSSIYEHLNKHHITFHDNDFKNLASNLISDPKSLGFYDLLKGVVWKSDTEPSEKIISRQLDRIDKKIIIFLDNIERLSVEEIHVVFNLLNLFGRSSKLQHVVSYDRDQIIKILDMDIKEGAARRYLEKLFMFEITITPIDVKISSGIFNEALNEIMSAISDEKKREVSRNFSDVEREECLKLIHTPRELKRIILYFGFAFENVGINTDLKDLLLMIILKVKYPMVFETLSFEMTKLFEYSSDRGPNPNRENIYSLLKAEDSIEARTILNQLIPGLSENSPKLSKIRTDRRFYDLENYIYYFKLDVNISGLSPDEIYELLKSIRSGRSFIEYGYNEYLISIDNIGHEIERKMVQAERKDIVKTLLSHLFAVMPSEIKTYEYSVIAGRIKNLLSLLKGIDADDCIKHIISISGLHFFLLFRLGSYSENKFRLRSESSDLTKIIQNSICDKLSGPKSNILPTLSAYNLRAVVIITGQRLSSEIKHEINLSPVFVFKCIELSVRVIENGEEHKFLFDQSEIFKIINRNELLTIGNAKVSGIMGKPYEAKYLKLLSEFEKYVNSTPL